MKSLLLLFPLIGAPSEDSLGTHGFADSNGVKIHYVTRGEGPLVILIHGFPDYWYTWRNQMPALSERFQAVAVDLRGYNESDKPEGIENYTTEKLVGDMRAVIRHVGREKAIVVGHDWGGMIAWNLAMSHPETVERLVILNLPHPKGFLRELAGNPEQRKNSQYARDFQKPEAAALLSPEILARWVEDREARARYVEAFKRSSMEGMLNYYKANYPREPYDYDESREFPRVDCPVLMFHGLKDKYLLSDALSGTWDWLARDLTLVTIPEAGHFVQHDAAELVTKRMMGWLGE
ncbi:MAG: Epoxide hydrolase A [bacterium]|nr:Epoxide hydrolase A [bacterium]